MVELNGSCQENTASRQGLVKLNEPCQQGLVELNGSCQEHDTTMQSHTHMKQTQASIENETLTQKRSRSFSNRPLCSSKNTKWLCANGHTNAAAHV